MDNQENKVDIDRIKKLLGDFKTDKSNDGILPYKQCVNTSQEGITIDKTDLCRAMSFRGNIVGYTNSSYAKNLSKDIIFNVGADNIQKAKTILIIYSIHPHCKPLNISDFMETIDSLCSDECELCFGTEIDDSLDKNMIQYKVLLTGIENTQNFNYIETNTDKSLAQNTQLENRYNELVKKYNDLKILNERLELSLLSLKK